MIKHKTFRLNHFPSGKEMGWTGDDNILHFKADNAYTSTTVFVSHSHKQRKEVAKAINFIRRMAHNTIGLYMDHADPKMPNETSVETGKRIRNKIDECQRFLFVGTEMSLKSNWCNWEIGYADKNWKSIWKKIAILPLQMDDDEFEGYEFLELYPVIQWNGFTKTNINNYHVIFPDKSQQTLLEWLQMK